MSIDEKKSGDERRRRSSDTENKNRRTSRQQSDSQRRARIQKTDNNRKYSRSNTEKNKNDRTSVNRRKSSSSNRNAKNHRRDNTDNRQLKRVDSRRDKPYDYDENPFFSNSSVKSQVEVRTNRADDFFENKDYKPWDTNDEFNKRNANSPRVKRKAPSKVSRMTSLKKGVGRVSRSVFSSEGSDEAEDFERGGIAENLKSNKSNKRLLDELNSNKKPLTKRQRKFKSGLLSGIIVLVVLIIGVTLSLTVLFKCEGVEVIGTTRYSSQDIINASNLKYGENIFLADKGDAKKRIEEKYPYIETAEIGFTIPNTITIKVTEATPEYYIQDSTKFFITSKESKLLEEVTKRELDIPSIIGCKLKNPKVGEIAQVEDDRVITVLNEVANSMEINSVIGIKEIDLTDMSNIELNYEDRITIVIGMPEHIDYKMRTAMTIISTKLTDSDKGRLDCSNLIEGRTDDKDNASYFQPNHFVTEPATQAQTSTEPTGLSQTATEQQTDIEATQSIIEPTEEYTEFYNEENIYSETEENSNNEQTDIVNVE